VSAAQPGQEATVQDNPGLPVTGWWYNDFGLPGVLVAYQVENMYSAARFRRHGQLLEPVPGEWGVMGGNAQYGAAGCADAVVQACPGKLVATAQSPGGQSVKLDLRTQARQSLIRLGGHLGTRALHDARNILGALTLGRWLADHPPTSGSILRRPDKTGVYRDALTLVTGTKPLYLEFGVWQGLSLRWWSEHLTTPGARFVGFDSFEGLPEQWRPDYPPGTFAVGQPPAIDDPRVSFQVGWFDDTLRSFELPDHDQLIINVDCTLYSSTATVLQFLEKYLSAGDLIYFDELPEYDHELRAFFEHVERCGWVLRPVSQALGYFGLFTYE
jgi:hypothetical protein